MKHAPVHKKRFDARGALTSLALLVLAVGLFLGHAQGSSSPVPQAINVAPNPGFELLAKRLGGWTHVGCMPTGQDWRVSITNDHAFSGMNSLRIEPGPFPAQGELVRGTEFFADYNGGEGQRQTNAASGVTGARTVALRLDPTVASIECSAWVRAPAGQRVIWSAVWTGRHARKPVVELHRDSISEPTELRGEWRRFVLACPRPIDAVQLQLVITTEGASPFYVDDVALIFVPRPERHIRVNQLGYDISSRAKRAILQSTTPIEVSAPARLVDLRTSSEIAQVPWKSEGFDPRIGAFFWAADFSDVVRSPGEYVVVFGEGREAISSPRFVVGTNWVATACAGPAVRFYYEQRCGTNVPGVHAACHLDDGCLVDGAWRDLSGGWHDAGDYNKYNGLTPEALRFLAQAGRQRPDLFATGPDGGLSSAAGEALWGAVWIEKMLDDRTLSLRDRIFSGYRYWGPPERETDNRPGTRDERPAGGAQGQGQGDRGPLVEAFATLGADLSQSADPGLAERGRRYVALAERLFKIVGGDLPALHALSRATGLALYRDEASRRVQERLQQSDDALLGGFRELASYALLSGDAALLTRLKPVAAKKETEIEALCQGPFRVAMRRNAAGVLVYCREYEDVNDWYVGEAAYRLDIAIDALLAARLGVPEARALAEHQLNWLLGCNPAGVSLMEGVGSVFVPGYHHRYNAIPGNPRGAVTGAILNGFVRAFPHVDRPWLDFSPEPNADYHSNEPWLLQNNRLLGLLCWW